MQVLYEYSLEGLPVQDTGTAPAVAAIERACRELRDSRPTPTAQALVRNIAANRKQLLDKYCGQTGQIESAYALVSELERLRAANIHGIDTDPSFVSHCIYQIHANYTSVFDQLGASMDAEKAIRLIGRLRKLPLL